MWHYKSNISIRPNSITNAIQRMDRLLIALLMYSDRGDDDDTERKTPMDNVKPSTGNFEH